MKAIIFGSNGQDGFYLTEKLVKLEINVIGISSTDNIEISNYSQIVSLIKSHLPEYIFHFAAISNTKHDTLSTNKRVIVDGALNLMEAVKNYSSGTKIFISGSGLQFENNGMPIKEEDVFKPRDAYSLCRIQSVYAARYYRSLGVLAYVGYFFNHDSPRRNDSHLTRKIFDIAKRISEGSMEKLEIGDLDAKKEYTFAGDIVDAIWMFINQSDFYETIIGSGKCYSVRDWVEICFEGFGLDYKNHIVTNTSFISPYSTLVSDNSLIRSIGWSPKISIYELFEMMKNETT